MRFPQSPQKISIAAADGRTVSGSGCDYGMPSKQNKASGCSPKQDFALVKAELERSLPYLPKHCLVDIRKQVTAQFVKRFKRSRIPKYGTLNKGFTEQEVGAFFRAIDSPKFHLLLSYQAQMGLRIGEAIRVSLKDIRFESRELVVKTEKAMTLDTLLIPAPLFQETLDFIQAHVADIEKAGGCVFFKEEGHSRLDQPCVAENYVRNRFRFYAEKAGLLEVYDQSDESRPNRAVRNLHRLTPLQANSVRSAVLGFYAKDREPTLIEIDKAILAMRSNRQQSDLMRQQADLIDQRFRTAWTVMRCRYHCT